MKNFIKFAGRAAVAGAVLIAVACLPVIPVIESPVTVMTIERLKLVSLVRYFTNFGMVGVRLQATTWTLPVMLVLFVALAFAGRRLRRFVFRRATIG